MSDHHNVEIRRVAILFAGGPAPAANAVISTAAFAFIKEGVEVIGIKHGYSRLSEYTTSSPMVEGRDFIRFTNESLTHMRTSRGIMIGTARTNPANTSTAPPISMMPNFRRRCVAFMKVSAHYKSMR